MTERARALRFIVLMGTVSLFADACYEGARSAIGPYLGHLGADATAVGLVAGSGELVGYGMRYLTGRLADRTRAYWTLTIIGYSTNLIAVPALALVGHWWAAAGLVVLERLGKAIRNPARSTLLSFAAGQVGEGKSFAIHEAMDQAGAVIGPLVVAAVVYERGYHWAFAILLVPAVLAMASLFSARAQFPDPRELAPKKPEGEPKALGRRFTLYLIGVGLVGCGLADWPLLAFHLDRRGIAGDALVPVIYAGAMASDGLAALLVGGIYDRSRKAGGSGLRVLVVCVVIAAASVPLVLLGGTGLALAGVALWALGLGATESIGKATVTVLSPASRRGAAFGLYYAIFGGSWWIGSAAIGYLSDRSMAAASAFSAASLGLAALMLLLADRSDR